MPEMRRDPITKNWIIIATERAKRPEKPAIEIKRPEEEIAYDKNCFFCSGNEHTTPPEVLAYRNCNTLPDTPGWSLRVVTNKFAALNLNQEFHIKQDNPIQINSYATGTAEVVIETTHHTKSLSTQPIGQIVQVLRAYRDRYIALSQEPSIKYILLFKNHGASAGASIPHPHSQIIATPVVPPKISEEFIGANDYFESTGRCIFCDMIKTEMKDRSRMIYENEHFISFTPYASRTPFECWVMPKFHSAKYQDLTDELLLSLAEVWRVTLHKIYRGLDNPPYNYYIHTSPTQKSTDRYYHWHMELIPKLTVSAGFEMGTGMYINIAIPEECAEYLREIE